MTEERAEGEVFCRDCGEKISERAEICPHCGIRQKDPPTPEQPATPPQKQKDSGIAAVASFIIPGLGQVYNGELAKGIIAGIVTIGLALTVDGLIFAVPMWIWLVYDAYQTAEELNSPATTQTRSTARVAEVNHKVIRVLEWYPDYADDVGGGYLKDVRRAYKNANSLEELSSTKLARLIEAIDAHQSEFGEDPDLADARKAMVAERERKEA
jgi:TM2 domain-containing membrane protein YozV